MVVDAKGITIMPIQNVELTTAADIFVSMLKRYDLARISVDILADADMEHPHISIRTYDTDGETCALSIFHDDEGGE